MTLCKRFQGIGCDCHYYDLFQDEHHIFVIPGCRLGNKIYYVPHRQYTACNPPLTYYYDVQNGKLESMYRRQRTLMALSIRLGLVGSSPSLPSSN